MYARIIQTFVLLVVAVSTGFAQSWPVKLSMDNGDQLKIYQPNPERFENGQLQFQSAVALQRKDSDMPVFGNMWATANTVTSGSNQLLLSLSVTGMRFPSEVSEEDTRQIQSYLESAIPSAHAAVNTASIQTAMGLNEQKKQLDAGFVNKAPKVFYRNNSSMLVMIDGEPKYKRNDDWGVDVVVNSPNTIVRYNNMQYYLYGGKRWYVANNVGGPYRYEDNPPAALHPIEESVAKNADKNQEAKSADYNTGFDDNQPVSEVLVSYEPAELIQSNGEASFSPIDNTNLLYVENSPNDIFMDIASQKYFVLISGRWYSAASLKGSWAYIAADKLPADFAKIPAGSAKDNVLASVAGTPAAENAVMDAQLPQTARVDRNTQPNKVTYDGTPQFQKISGTRMSYAINSSSTVLKYRNNFYLVENGVWFESGSPAGPWEVSTVRPDEVDLIPPSSPVYNTKYVYVYDYTPDYVYMGYTPGYLNTYVYGPTVVYGTGWYYQPWWGTYYFPRPYTWGFNMRYNPWWGWSFGFNYNAGWFNWGWGYNSWDWWSGGWWGPSMYRPGYCWPSYGGYGYYGYRNNHFYVNNYYNRVGGPRGFGYSPNNIYRSRNNIYSRDANRYSPISRPNRVGGQDYGMNRPGNNRPVTDINRNSRPATDLNRNSNPAVNNRGDLRRNADPRITDTRPMGDRGNISNRATPNPGFSARENTPQRNYQPAESYDIGRQQQMDRQQQLDRQYQSNRQYQPQAQPQMNRQQQFDRGDMQRQQPQYQRQQQQPQYQQQPSFDRGNRQQQRSFDRGDMQRQQPQYQQQQRSMPQMEQRSAPQMQQRSAPQMQHSAPAGGGGFGNRAGGGGGGMSRPSRH